MLKTKILFVPGWTYSEMKARPFVQELQTLGYDIDLLPVPGLTGPALTQAWNLDDYVSWLEKEIQTRVSPGEPYILLAHSNGGRIALKFLSTKNELSQRAQKLILIDSAGITDRRWYKVLKKDFLGLGAKAFKGLAKQDRLRKLLYKVIREKDYYEAEPVMRTTMANLLAVDLRFALPEITQPTLLIWGSADKMTPLILAKEMQKKMPQAELKIVVGARHVPQFTHLSETVTLITNFLEEKNDKV
ncbi:MAG: alpha/beta hydrolase [bacterium]|nr:alpha/beta hydrolase [bacterium]